MIWNTDLNNYKAPTSALTSVLRVLSRFAGALLLTIILGIQLP